MDRDELKRRLMGLPKEAVIDGFLGQLIVPCDEVYREALGSARRSEEAKCRMVGKQATQYLETWKVSKSADDFEAYMQANKEQDRCFKRAQAYYYRLMDAYKE